MDVDAQGASTGEGHPEAQPELAAIDEEGVGHIPLGHYIGFELRAPASEGDEPTSLR